MPAKLALRLSSAAALAGCLAACTPTLPLSTFDTGPTMRPEAFFGGRTSSWGVLAGRSGAPSRWFTVHGGGMLQQDGSFKLDQTIAWNDGKVDQRTWIMRRVGADDYAASLTDASGPMRGDVHGNLFHLSYPLKGVPGGSMEQWLYLQGDGRTVLNEGTVRVMGVTVYRLSERISHDQPDPPAAR